MVKIVVRVVLFMLALAFINGLFQLLEENEDSVMSWVTGVFTKVTDTTKSIAKDITKDINDNVTESKNTNIIVSVQNQSVAIKNEITSIEQTINLAIEAKSESTLISNYTQLNNVNTRITQLLHEVNNIKNSTSVKKELNQLQVQVNKLIVKVEKVVKENDVKCFYAIGTEEVLLEHNIIEKNWLGSLKVKSKGYDEPFYISGKRSELNQIHLYAKKAEILSDMPTSSYQLREINSFLVILVTNSEQFWSKTNYLVVKTE